MNRPPSRVFVTLAVLLGGAALACVLRFAFGVRWWLATVPLWGLYVLFALVAVVLAVVEFYKVRKSTRDARRR